MFVAVVGGGGVGLYAYPLHNFTNQIARQGTPQAPYFAGEWTGFPWTTLCKGPWPRYKRPTTLRAERGGILISSPQ